MKTPHGSPAILAINYENFPYLMIWISDKLNKNIPKIEYEPYFVVKFKINASVAQLISTTHSDPDLIYDFV